MHGSTRPMLTAAQWLSDVPCSAMPLGVAHAHGPRVGQDRRLLHRPVNFVGTTAVGPTRRDAKLGERADIVVRKSVRKPSMHGAEGPHEKPGVRPGRCSRLPKGSRTFLVPRKPPGCCPCSILSAYELRYSSGWLPRNPVVVAAKVCGRGRSPPMRRVIVAFLVGLASVGVTVVACKNTFSNHCFNNRADLTCIDRYGRDRPFCSGCVSENDGCVVDPVEDASCVPVPTCASSARNELTPDEFCAQVIRGSARV